MFVNSIENWEMFSDAVVEDLFKNQKILSKKVFNMLNYSLLTDLDS